MVLNHQAHLSFTGKLATPPGDIFSQQIKFVNAIYAYYISAMKYT